MSRVYLVMWHDELDDFIMARPMMVLLLVLLVLSAVRADMQAMNVWKCNYFVMVLRMRGGVCRVSTPSNAIE